jgi:hypothetical protein
MRCKFKDVLVQELWKRFAIVLRDEPQSPDVPLGLLRVNICESKQIMLVGFGLFVVLSPATKIVVRVERHFSRGIGSMAVSKLRCAALLLGDVRGGRVALLGKALVDRHSYSYTTA